jgi:hypothetical protein
MLRTTDAVYFTVDIEPALISVIQNDWPYSGIISHGSRHRLYLPSILLVPHDVEHSLVWSKLPVLHSALTHLSIAWRVSQDGLWGFTSAQPPEHPSPSALGSALHSVLIEWGVVPEQVKSISGLPPPTEVEEFHLDIARSEVNAFICKHWVGWETCWFVNPPVSNRRVFECVGI